MSVGGGDDTRVGAVDRPGTGAPPPGAPRRPGALLTPDELARLGSLDLRARVIVEGALAGLHATPHMGGAVEFAEHEDYAPGHDVRRIDWRAAARHDRLMVKRFEDETEMRTHLLLDASASMGYAHGGPSKLDWARWLCAALGFVLARQSDPAGLVVFDDGARDVLPPRTRSGRLADLLAALDGAGAAGDSNPAAALALAGQGHRQRGLVILVSDLLDVPEDTPARLGSLRARGHDLVVFHVLHPDEIALPWDELCDFQGLEPGDHRHLLADARELADAFARRSRAFREEWRARCLESRIEYRFAATSEPPSLALRDFLQARAHLRR